MNTENDVSLRPGGSGILPEETPPKFLARHLSAYYFTLPYIKGGDVLEIGFGDGYGANFLARHVNSVKAIDVLEKNVTLASAKYKAYNLEYAQMDAIGLHFKNETFDAIMSFQVIEHIPEDCLEKYLEGIRRVLKKDGMAFISTLNLRKNRKPNRPYNKNSFHIKEFTYEEFNLLIGKIFNRYDMRGLFHSRKLKFYERLKKTGIFKFLPKPLNIMGRFYNNITVNDFVWKSEDLDQCIDFMALCRKV